MVDCKEYRVFWRYNDQHHCDFSGELNFKDRNPESVLEQFKKTDIWERYGAYSFPNAYGVKEFFYKIEEAKDLSTIVNSK